MIINKMTATFGKLKNSTLELKPGLNIIHAPNEFGKSTWCAFIKAMLYGINTSERDRNGHLSDKTRYRPWDGGNMSGSMDFTFRGRDITIERSNLGNAPMKNFRALRADTGDVLEGLSGDSFGERVIGVPEHVFQRTAFIRRPELRVDKNPELEKRISLLVSSGEETASYTDADSTLRAWQRKLRYKQSGSLPALEAELEENKEKLRRLERMGSELADLRGSIERTSTQIKMLTDDLDAHKKLERRHTARKIISARTKAKVASEDIAALETALTRNGRLITQEDINILRNASTSVEALRSVRDDAVKAAWDAEKTYTDAHNLRCASPLNEKDTDKLSADIANAKILDETAKTAKTAYLPLLVTILLMLIGAAGIAAFTGLYFAFSIPGIITSGVIFLIGLLFTIIRPKTRKEAAAKLASLLSEYDTASVDDLQSKYDEYIALCKTEEEAKATRDATAQHLKQSSRAAEKMETEVRARVSTFLPDVTTHEKMLESLAEFEVLLDKLTKARFDKLSSTNIYETLIADFEGDVDEEETFIPMPLRNREDTEAALSRTQATFEDLYRSYNIALGEHRAIGDPVVIEGNIKSLSERIDAETERYDALALAIDVLNDANSELQTRFSPLIGQRASQMMTCLTNGRYEKLLFDNSFAANAKTSDDTVSRAVLSLSDGTVDEIYLSLRLAMCELIFPSEEPAPIILDDALVNFDNERCKRALELLISMTETRQIILFTCHEREKELVPEGANVNIIEGF